MNHRRVLMPAVVVTILLTSAATVQPVPAGQKSKIRFAGPVAYDTGGLYAGLVAVDFLRHASSPMLALLGMGPERMLERAKAGGLLVSLQIAPQQEISQGQDQKQGMGLGIGL